MKPIIINAKIAKLINAVAAKDIFTIANAGDYIVNCRNAEIYKLEESGLNTHDVQYYKKMSGDKAIGISKSIEILDEELRELEERTRVIKNIKENIKTTFVKNYIVGDIKTGIVLGYNKLGDESMTTNDIKLRDGDDLICLGRRYNHSPKSTSKGSSYWVALVEISGLLDDDIVNFYKKSGISIESLDKYNNKCNTIERFYNNFEEICSMIIFKKILQL